MGKRYCERPPPYHAGSPTPKYVQSVNGKSATLIGFTGKSVTFRRAFCPSSCVNSLISGAEIPRASGGGP